MIITIDGPAGSGKSSTAREVAKRLGFLHIDSGALYRAFALAACERGLASPIGEVAAEQILQVAEAEVDAEAEEGRIRPLLKGRRLGAEIRTPRVTACASWISAFPAIRERVNSVLRRVAARQRRGVVCEGRDMGTIVFPEAELKVYMDASPEERARRRLRQRGDEVTERSIRAEAARLIARDTADSERDVCPLRVAEGALVIDTTHLDFEEQVGRIVGEAKRRLEQLDMY